MFKKILVCLDGSHLAEQILPYATDTALRFGSKLVMVQVIAPSKSYLKWRLKKKHLPTLIGEW